MADKKLTGADYLLLLLYLDNKSPIKGAIRLMKMMFIFNEQIQKKLDNVKQESLFGFEPFDFGPFSKDVYQAIEFFNSIGFISVKTFDIKEKDEHKMIESDDYQESAYIDEIFESDNDFEKIEDYKYYQYKILPKGIEYIETEILKTNMLAKKQLEYLTLFKQKIIKMTPQEILRYVYTKYPEYITKSKIKDKVLENES